MTIDSPELPRGQTPLPPLSTPDQPSLDFSIRVPPDWRRIEQVRECVVSAVEAVYAPVLVGDTTGIVVAELLENAIKYGSLSPCHVAIEGDRREIRVAVTNHLDPATSNPETLGEHVAWIQSFDEPQEAYMACLTMAFQRSGTRPSGSGLGLARIRYEGGCTLAIDVQTPGRLTVLATQALEWDAPLPGA
ncbi:MAG: hypothetical protein AAF602_26250 [Myxococcota bacterium]